MVVFGGVEEYCCEGTKGCGTDVCGEKDVGRGAERFIAVGGSIRLAIDGDADARLTCGEACAGCMLVVGGWGGRDASIVEPLIGS